MMNVSKWVAGLSLLGALSAAPIIVYAQSTTSIVRSVNSEEYGISFDIPEDYITMTTGSSASSITFHVFSPDRYETHQECRNHIMGCPVHPFEHADLNVLIKPATPNTSLREQILETFRSRRNPIFSDELIVSDQQALVFLGDYGMHSGYYTSFLTPDQQYLISIQVAPEYTGEPGQYEPIEVPQNPELRDMVLESLRFDSVLEE